MHGNKDDDHEMQEIICQELAEERQCVCVTMGSLPKLHNPVTGVNAGLHVDLIESATVPIRRVDVCIFKPRRELQFCCDVSRILTSDDVHVVTRGGATTKPTVKGRREQQCHQIHPLCPI